MMPDVAKSLHEAANVFEERNAVYQDAYLIVGKVTEALFPNGVSLVTEEDHNRWHLLELIIVKLTRYSANWKTGHKESMDDLVVYGAMLRALDIEMAEEVLE
jgi:hypothetical protein